MRIIQLPLSIRYRHAAAWILVIVYFLLDNPISGTSISQFSYRVISIVDLMFGYYLLFLIIFPNFFASKKILFILLSAATAVLYVLIDYVNTVKLPPLLGGQHREAGQSLKDFTTGSVLLFSFTAFASVGSYLNWRSIERIKEVAETEKGIISRELNFLKDQFHSHLTFNFLNFCYGKMLKIAPKAAESVEDFSEMLRYSLSGKPQEYVSLQKEVDYIHNFIAVQKCLSNSVYVTFNPEGSMENITILPMLLAVFVENAFKHGTFNDPKHPIEIRIVINESVLLMEVKNRKANITAMTTTGIGLANAKQLLQLFYPSKHTLIVTENENAYKTELSLTI